MVKGLIRILGVVLLSGTVNATELSLPEASNPLELAGRDGAIQQIENLTQSTDLEKIRRQTGYAIDAILRSAIESLKQRGQHHYANQIQSEWNGTYSLYFFGGISLLDLGDHAPLIPWLAKTMNNLEGTLGRSMLKKTRIYDLKVMNYAIPVVFAPGGNRYDGKEWGQEEYGKHFVPMVGVVTYWTTRIACKQLAKNQPIVSRFCKDIAGVAEKIVVKKVALRMSNSVYARANAGRKK